MLSLSINSNGNETFQMVLNSTETANPVGILFDAGCETAATFLSTVRRFKIYNFVQQNDSVFCLI